MLPGKVCNAWACFGSCNARLCFRVINKQNLQRQAPELTMCLSLGSWLHMWQMHVHMKHWLMRTYLMPDSWGTAACWYLDLEGADS